RGHLAVRQEPTLAGLAEAGHLVPDPGDPECRLQIAQAALALLQVRLEQPDRASVARAALVELLQLVVDELLDPTLLQLGDGGAHHLLPAGPGAVARQDLLAALRQPGLYLSHRGVVRHPRTIARRRANESSAKFVGRRRRAPRRIALRRLLRGRLLARRFPGR